MFWAVALWAVAFAATLIAIPWIAVRLPADYFHPDRPRPARELFGTRARVLHWLRNIAGVVLVIIGIALLVLPGQGVLTILIGLSLIEFPGKLALERKLARQRAVLRAINWIRRRAGREPLTVPPRESDQGDSPGIGRPRLRR